MNSSTADTTETRSDRQDNKIIGTPVLEENIHRSLVRDDISATLKCESIFDFQINDDSTPMHSERGLAYENEHSFKDNGIKIFNPAEDVNEDRITLLARKYADKDMIPEDAARLEILTQRLRNTMPAITEKDLEKMEYLNKQLESGIKLNDRLQKKYK